MLSFFKSNNPLVVIFYVFYLALFRVCFVYLPVDADFVFEHNEPLSSLVFHFLKTLTSNYQLLSLVLSAVLCFVQAILINGVVNSNKILPRTSYTAGALFIIFSSFFKESLVLSPASVAFTFLILSTGRLFSLLKQERPYAGIFDVGFFIAIATLFYFPSVLFFVFGYIGLSVVRAFHVREWVIVLMGFLSPLIVVFTFYFWNDLAGNMLYDICNLHQQGWLSAVHMSSSDWFSLGAVVIIVFGSVLMLPATLYANLIQVRKYSMLLAVFIFFTGLSVLLQSQISLSHLILLALPLGIITSLIINRLKNNFVVEVIHLILILLVIAGQFFPLILNLF